MKKVISKVIQTEETVCDICQSELSDNLIHKGDMDLCYECAGRILRSEVINKISNEKLAEWINNQKNNVSEKDETLFSKVKTVETIDGVSSLDEI